MHMAIADATSWNANSAAAPENPAKRKIAVKSLIVPIVKRHVVSSLRMKECDLQAQATKPSTYIHLEEIPLDVGITAIRENLEMREKAQRVPVGSYDVHVTSLRLRTFCLKGTKCYLCGTEATHFSLDRFRNKSQLEHPHMNLWGVDAEGNELLFTHDHIVDRADGGADNLSNVMPCCTKCNGEKAAKHLRARQGK